MVWGSSEADEGQDGHDNDHKADEIDDGIHCRSPSVFARAKPGGNLVEIDLAHSLEHENQKQNDQRQGDADQPEQKSCEHETESLIALCALCLS